MKTGLFFLTFLVVSQTWAGLRCEKALLPVELRDSAVEIEIRSTILDRLFTTTDGTIGPVLDSVKPQYIPRDLLQQLRESFPDQPIQSIPWDVLTMREKEDLIVASARARKQDFFEDRTVHGLKYRDQFELTFNATTELMGKVYPPGKYTFNSSDFFTNTKIEFMGPKSISEKLGFEIHLRRADGADKNLISATSLQKALIGSAAPVHQHVVAPIPLEALAKNPQEMAFKMMDFFRRVSLHAQLLRIKRGHAIEELSDSDGDVRYQNMPLLQKDDLQHLYHYFWRLGVHLKTQPQRDEIQRVREEGTLVEKLKMRAKLFFKGTKSLDAFADNPLDNQVVARKSGLIGMRVGRVYDGDGTLWGLEFRDLAQSHEQTHLQEFLRAAQTRMLLADFGLKDSTVREAIQGATDNQLMDRIYYPSVAHGEFVDPTSGKIQGQTNDALGMILHDWTKDPLFIEHPEYISKLEEARKIALTAIEHGEHPTQALARFVKRSGLDYLVWQSLRID